MIQAKAINHIGIAVKKLADHHAYYTTVLGAEYENIEEVAEQKVRVAFYKVGGVRIELLEPTSEESPIAKFIEKKGEGIHHIAYTVDNIQARLDALKAGGIQLIDQTPRNGAHHTKIAFIHPKSSQGILTEICEPAHH